MSRTPLAMYGEEKSLVTQTSWLLTTPAPAATKPFRSVARPKMVERSPGERDADVDSEMSHDSNTEKSMEVDVPPKILPNRSTTKWGTVIQMQDSVYVMQKTRHNFLRPLIKSSISDQTFTDSKAI